jgi:hypothetical protein
MWLNSCCVEEWFAKLLNDNDIYYDGKHNSLCVGSIIA